MNALTNAPELTKREYIAALVLAAFAGANANVKARDAAFWAVRSADMLLDELEKQA